jgi:hypothetical protein
LTSSCVIHLSLSSNIERHAYCRTNENLYVRICNQVHRAETADRHEAFWLEGWSTMCFSMAYTGKLLTILSLVSFHRACSAGTTGRLLRIKNTGSKRSTMSSNLTHILTSVDGPPGSGSPNGPSSRVSIS